MAGRPRKPTALKEAQGTARPDRANPLEPQYAIETPEKPAHVHARIHASAEWDRIVPILLEQRVLSPAYRAALEGYCLSYADVVDGEILKGSAGFAPFVSEAFVDSTGQEHAKLKPHPVVKMVDDAKKELRQWAGQLGLTPTTVAKVKTQPHATHTVSPLARLLTRVK
jgi:P27 family predicted phage terminase small subunit